MKTLEQVNREMKQAGVNITSRTFWRYVEMGLVPEGRKFEGMGNIFFFEDYVPERIVQIQILKKRLGMPLHIIRKSLLFLTEDQPWNKTVVRKQPSGVEMIFWWTGIMARLRLLDKPKLEPVDFQDLFKPVKQMFEAFGVRE